METEKKLIAEFLGYYYCEKYQYEGWYKNSECNERICDKESLFFDRDWNMLMEAVKKVRRIDQTAKGDFKIKLLSYKRNYATIIDLSILDNIVIVYNKMIDFIKWYNENKN